MPLSSELSYLSMLDIIQQTALQECRSAGEWMILTGRIALVIMESEIWTQGYCTWRRMRDQQAWFCGDNEHIWDAAWFSIWNGINWQNLWVGGGIAPTPKTSWHLLCVEANSALPAENTPFIVCQSVIEKKNPWQLTICAIQVLVDV